MPHNILITTNVATSCRYLRLPCTTYMPVTKQFFMFCLLLNSLLLQFDFIVIVVKKFIVFCTNFIFTFCVSRGSLNYGLPLVAFW